MKYIKSAARVLDRDCVNKRGLYLSKEVLWVLLGQRVAEIPAIKATGLKRYSVIGLAQAKQVRTRLSGRIVFDLQL